MLIGAFDQSDLFEKKLFAYYQSNEQKGGCPVHGIVKLSNEASLKFGIDEKTMAKIYDSISQNAPWIDPQIFEYTQKTLDAGINKVFNNVKYDDPEFNLVQKMKRNIAKFCGYKSFHQTQVLANENIERVPRINQIYNTNYLRTEYTHTVRSCRASKNFIKYQQDKDVYPYLKYVPSSAAEPRKSHQKLYGIIKHVDDSFWDTWMPPAAWGCLCSVKQVKSNENSQMLSDEVPLPPKAMRSNPGKNGIIITDDHPMILKAQKYGYEKELLTAFEELKDQVAYPPYNNYSTKSGGYVKIHPFCDANDIESNVAVSKLIVDKTGGEILVRPHINLQGRKNPELMIDGVIGDIHTIKSSNIKRSISNGIDGKFGKKGQLRNYDNAIIVFDTLHDFTNDEMYLVFTQLKSRLLKYGNIKEVIIAGKSNVTRGVNLKNIQRLIEETKIK